MSRAKQSPARAWKFRNIELVAAFLHGIAMAHPDAAEVSMTWKPVGKGDHDALDAMLLGLRKHLTDEKSGELRNDARKIARSLLLDILSNEKDLHPFADIIQTFAAQNDRLFFEQLGKGVYGGRKPLWSRSEWYLLLNWDAPFDNGWPPLKRWTHRAIAALVAVLLPEQDAWTDEGCRKSCNRLKLRQEKPLIVKDVTVPNERPNCVLLHK